MLVGTPFIHYQQGSLSDVGMPPTWEKGSHLPPGTTKLGNLRMVMILPQLLLLNQIWDSPLLCWESTEVSGPPRDARNVTGWYRYTRWTGRLSNQTSNLSHLAICCQRVVICASLDTGIKGMQVVTYPANIKQLKSH